MWELVPLNDKCCSGFYMKVISNFLMLIKTFMGDLLSLFLMIDKWNTYQKIIIDKWNYKDK